MTNQDMAKNRFNGHVKPMGDYDDHGLWKPIPWERCQCCQSIKKPSRNRPLTLLKHCRTRKHVTNLVEKHKAK